MHKKKEMKAPSAIERIGAYSVDPIIVKYNGHLIEIVCKQLTTYAEVKACGNFSLIETFHDKLLRKELEKDIAYSDIIAYSEFQYNVMRAALINPTFDEIYKTILETRRINKSEIDKGIKFIQTKLDELEIKHGSQKEIKLFADELAVNKMQYEFIFPADFIGDVVSYALQIDETDIKKVSADMLYEVALLAQKGHDNPSDHLSGVFTDFNRADIDKRSWLELYDRQNAGE